MVRVEIVQSLLFEIQKKFSKYEANEILDLLETLKENPNKGKHIANINGILIKEIKYKKYRFYCVTNGFLLHALNKERLIELLIRFVKLSEKNNQQQTIDEIKITLKTLGLEGFN